MIAVDKVLFLISIVRIDAWPSLEIAKDCCFPINPFGIEGAAPSFGRMGGALE
jgi:hypothetical protein